MIFLARKDNKGRNLRIGESQRKDGRYMYRCLDERTGQRITIYDTELPALRVKEKKLVKDIEDGIALESRLKNMTVNELFARYLETKNLAGSTRANYIATWNNHVRNELGNLKVTQIKPSHIKLLYARMTKDGYSHSVIKLIHNLIFPSFELAVDDDIIRKNPAKNALGDYGEPPKEKKALTLEQQKALLWFVEQSDIYRIYLPMLQIMIGTGCRVGELIGLTWSDVDLKKKELYITCQLVYKNYGDGCKFHLTIPKTEAGIRTLPLSEIVCKAFEAQRRLNFMQGIPRDVEVEGRTGYIFVSKNGRPLMPNAVNNVLYNIVDAYNELEQETARKEKRKVVLMPRVSAHSFRHTSCTRMAELGMDMKVVQYLMGHANIGVTMEVYNHITDQSRVQKEVEKMNSAAM